MGFTNPNHSTALCIQRHRSCQVPLAIFVPTCHHPASPTDEASALAHLYWIDTLGGIDANDIFTGSIVPDISQGDVDWLDALEAFWDFDYYNYLRNLHNAPAVVKFPVGGQYHAVDWTGAIIPELVSGVTVSEALGVPGTIDRRDKPVQNEAFLPVRVAVDWFEYWELIAQGVEVLAPGTVVGIPEPVSAVPVITATVPVNEDDEMAWYDDLDQEWFGGLLPGGTPPFWEGAPSPTIPGVPGLPVIPPGMPPGMPAIPTSGPCATDDPYRGYVYKRVCGQFKWVKQKRRRRKQLLSKSDSTGLAALKGIVGVGKTMDVWIATHS